MQLAIPLKLVRREERLRAPECSRLANYPSSYGILTDHNVGANVELARTTCSVVSHPDTVPPGNF